MKIIQKAALLLALVLLLSTAAFAATVTTAAETIGGAAAQVVYVTPSANTEIRAIIANGQLGTTAEAEAVIAREGKKIVAAINGNFYNCWYDRNKPLSVMENNYPRIYGAIVTDGKMLNSGASVALGIASDGSMKIARATIKGTLTLGRTRIVAWCVNTSNSDPQACYILTDELALGVDIPESSEIVIVRDGTVEDVQSGCANFRTPSGAVAMVLNSGCYVRGMARVGMRAEYGFCVTDGDSDMENMKNIIGGTGMIVEHGVSAVDNNPNVTADDQDPDTVSVRSFAAITADGRLMLAGTTYPTDRGWEAQRLGFAAVCENSLDGVSDRDFCVELMSACALIMMHLSRLSEELILWSSWEFQFIELDNSFTTGSSIMPQKKNPDMAELCRGKTGRVYGDLIALLTTLKGLPLAYNKDMQEDKEAVFDCVDTTKLCLQIMAPMLSSLRAKPEVMLLAAQKGFINATDLADYLTKKGENLWQYVLE